MSKLPESVQHLAPLYVVMGRAPGENALKGYIENSFNMDWSPERVRLWWTGFSNSMIGRIELDGKRDAEYQLQYIKNREVEVYNLEDENCPIEIDLERWIKTTSKFEERNPPFKFKESF